MAGCGGGGTPGASFDAMPTGPDAQTVTGETYTIKMGPIVVPAGGENTQCIEQRLSNVDHKWISQLHTHLNGVSHHMIVYRETATTEQLTPFDCTPFLETLNPASTSTPLMVSQIHDETLALPLGVAFGIDPNQMVRIELHYINTGDADAMVDAQATFDVQPDGQFQNEADFLFVGDPDIKLAPGAGQLGPITFNMPGDLAGISIFAMTGHEHSMGTDVEVDRVENVDALPVPIYKYPNFSWSEPPVERFSPPIVMPTGSQFQFTCKWNNTTPNQIKFGESAKDEMCFFWAYYYPSKGHKVCIHTDTYLPGVDLCCPGDSICNMVPVFH